MTPLVSQLWPQFMADPAFASCFGQVIVEHARMLRQSQQVIFTLRSAAPLDKGLCARLLASLQPDYEGFELKIENHFGYAMLDEAALRDLLEEMKADGVPINGFLDRCSITILGQSITVGVRHGTKFLQEMGFEKLLADCIARHTGVTPKVNLISAVSEAEQHQMEEKLERKIAPPVVKFEKKNTAPSIKVEGLDLTDKPVTIFHGKMFTPKNLTPLKDLGGEGGKCVIWGDVFFTEVKGNYRKIYTVSITDYTGSINLKIRAQEGEDCSKWENIAKGTTLLVRGDCTYDKYEHDYIVYPYDVLFVERKKREDNAPEKRVELHLHTKLSSMDAFCDPGGIVKLAHRMGHPAIAITDHGVCQGYPEAMLATDEMAKGFEAGSHATTFGGGALASGVAAKCVEIMLRDKLADRAAELGKHVMDRVRAIQDKLPGTVREVRGLGLMIGIELAVDAAAVWRELIARGFICNLSHGVTLRLLPALTIDKADLDAFIDTLEDILRTAK